MLSKILKDGMRKIFFAGKKNLVVRDDPFSAIKSLLTGGLGSEFFLKILNRYL